MSCLSYRYVIPNAVAFFRSHDRSRDCYSNRNHDRYRDHPLIAPTLFTPVTLDPFV